MAKLLEATEHWGAIHTMQLGAKKPPQPSRMFEHPDRPGSPEVRAALSVADFERLYAAEKTQEKPEEG